MRSTLVLGLCLIFSATVLSAQTISTSQIRGVIQDSSGAAVAGASVTLTQTATGATRSTTSAADGAYAFPDLSVGSYDLEVTKSGFSKYVQKGIVLQVGVNPTIIVSLTVGAVTQEVTVQAEAVTVETQNTGVGEVVAPQEVQDLPLNGRQLTDLLTLTGAVGEGRAFRASYPSSAVISIAGGAQGSVAYWLDGGTHNDPLSNQNLPLPFPDTVQEFTVETSSLPAQYGTHPSGSVSVITKSGTNSFHGDAFEYVRNFMFDSKNTAFATALADGAAFRPPLKRNQFGGTIGGPVKKDKLFFFAGWQDTIQRSSNPAETTLPTQAMLNGDFSQCLGSSAESLGPPFGPASGVTAVGAPYANPDGDFGYNQTNPANFSPIIRALEKHLPVAPPSNVCGTYNYQAPSNFTENQGLARVDYHPSDKNTVFARYFITNWEQPPAKPETLSSGDPDLLIAAIDGASNRVQNLTIGDTYLFGSNIVNNFRATGNRSRNLTLQNTTLDLAGLLSEAEADPIDPLLPNQIGAIYQQGPPKFPKFMPNFAVTAGFGGLFNSTPSLQPYDTLEFSDDLSLTRGAHQLSFGVDFINLRAFATNYLFNQGDFTFDGNRTDALPFPLATAGLPDFVMGWTSATSGFAQDAPIPSIQHQNIFALYAQDSWKVTRRVTVTAGLRWDPFFGHTDPKGHVVSISVPDIIADVHSTKFPFAPAGYLFQGDPGGPTDKKLSKNALDKWSPRIGVAWDPEGNGRMSIRAGFGIFYDFPNFSYDQFGFEEPWGGAATAPGGDCTATCISDPWGTTAEGSLANRFTFCPYPCVNVAADSVPGNPFGAGPGSADDFVGAGPTKSAYLPSALVFSYPQTVKPTYVMQYNLSVEKQLGKTWLISATYLGSQQRHLWGNNEANPGLQGPCTTNGGGLGPGAYPETYPFPPGITCGAGGTTVAGPCPPNLAPFICNTFGSFFSLNNNRLFQHFGTLCSQTTSCYGETLLLEEEGTGNYNGLLLTAQHQFANHFTSTTNFTWSHCISDNYTTTLGFFLAAESVPYDRRADRGNCPSADTHLIFNQALVAETPQFSNHTEDILLGHWRFSLSGLVQSGLDISPILLVDYSGSGNGLTERPNLVPGVDPYCQPKGRTCWLNPKAFVDPPPYTFGDAPNNGFFGPGAIIFNTALERIFQIREGQQLMFRWEVYNLPNHANLYLPSTAGAGLLPTFGQPTPASTAGLGALNQTTNDPRVMQFALKYSF